MAFFCLEFPSRKNKINSSQKPCKSLCLNDTIFQIIHKNKNHVPGQSFINICYKCLKIANPEKQQRKNLNMWKQQKLVAVGKSCL